MPAAMGSLPHFSHFPIRLSSDPGGTVMIIKRLTTTQTGSFSTGYLSICRCYSIFLRTYHRGSHVSPFDKNINALLCTLQCHDALYNHCGFVLFLFSADNRQFSHQSQSLHNIIFSLILHEYIDLIITTTQDVFCCCYFQVLKIILLSHAA